MLETGYLAVFLIGLLGGVHCVGMCGGIVTALSVPSGNPWRDFGRQFAYSAGRISTYALMGCLVGALGSASLLFNQILPVQISLYVLANVMLVGMGLYLTGITSGLDWMERLGQRLWPRIRQLGKPFLPVRRWYQALPVGFVWGFLPCGMTYAVLSLALVSGSALKGAGLMLAFGVGTLPNLLLAGMLLVRSQIIVRHRLVRRTAGAIVVLFGLYGLVRTPELGGALWNGVLCSPQ